MKVDKAYVILAFIVAILLIILMFIVNAGVGFLLLASGTVAICMIYKKKPEFFSVFKRKAKNLDDIDDPIVKKDAVDVFRPRVVLINNTSLRPEQIEVDCADFAIGRSPECNYVLHGNSKVSRKHCRIICDEASSKSFLLDDQSKFGTRLNGEIVEHGIRKQLHNGDIIQIEDTSFSVQTKNY